MRLSFYRFVVFSSALMLLSCGQKPKTETDGRTDSSTGSSAATDVRVLGLHGVDKPIGSHSPNLKDAIEFGSSLGENYSVLLKVETNRCLNLSMEEFKAEGKPSWRPRLKSYRLESIKITMPSYQDAPLGDVLDSLIPINLADPLCPKTASPKEPIWIFMDMSSPDATAPGIYTAHLSSNGTPLIRITNHVWKSRMTLETTFRLYSGLPSWFNLLGHFGQWTPEEGNLQKKYLDEIGSLHINAFDAWIVDPPIVHDSSGNPHLDLESYPSPSDSFISVYASHIQSGMISMPNPFNNPNISSPSEYLIAIENSLQQYGWQNGRAYIYLWDEPAEANYPEIIERAKLVRRYAPSLKILVTTHFVPELEPYVDIWTVVINQMDNPSYPSPEIYLEQQAKGKQVWLYVSCMSHGCTNEFDAGTPDFVIDRQSSYIRSLGLMAYLYHADALLYWRMNNMHANYPARDAWNEQWNFTGNGDGTLLYPGRPGVHGLESHQPILSLRAKAIEEALNDVWYYRQMDKLPNKPAWWSTAIHELVRSPTSWDKDYSKYQDLLERVGNYLNENAP